ncbi:MAG: chemotaxis protein MotB [Candidatus Tokpelaia sp. JSC188]|nr:MAG: chemotaxis protein MotB [Candidatus Tokpelaia sp. JSC188]
MQSTDSKVQNEIIIIRRSYDNDDDGHAGDVWKIAYADLMTAMMVFFLIMWLINVIDNDKKIAIAHYFNPINLVEFKSSPRGIDDVTNKIKSNQDKQSKTLQKTGGDLKTTAMNHSPKEESHAILSDQMRDLHIQKGVDAVKLHRDPFNPEWNTGISFNRIFPIDNKLNQNEQDKSAKEKNQISIEQKVESEKVTHPTDNVVASNEGRYVRLADNISTDIAALIKSEIKADYPQVHVHIVDDGVIIELTDSQNYGMFPIGSAKPDQQVTILLDGIAKIMEKYEGQVIISGYTDARPYKAGHYDNWQLSAARAQAACYMLIRGGFDESRILRVEGYADHNLKNSQDSYADENRRITIFLQLAKTKIS